MTDNLFAEHARNAWMRRRRDGGDTTRSEAVTVLDAITSRNVDVLAALAGAGTRRTRDTLRAHIDIDDTLTVAFATNPTLERDEADEIVASLDSDNLLDLAGRTGAHAAAPAVIDAIIDLGDRRAVAELLGIDTLTVAAAATAFDTLAADGRLDHPTSIALCQWLNTERAALVAALGGATLAAITDAGILSTTRALDANTIAALAARFDDIGRPAVAAGLGRHTTRDAVTELADRVRRLDTDLDAGGAPIDDEHRQELRVSVELLRIHLGELLRTDETVAVAMLTELVLDPDITVATKETLIVRVDADTLGDIVDRCHTARDIAQVLAAAAICGPARGEALLDRYLERPGTDAGSVLVELATLSPYAVAVAFNGDLRTDDLTAIAALPVAVVETLPAAALFDAIDTLLGADDSRWQIAFTITGDDPGALTIGDLVANVHALSTQPA